MVENEVNFVGSAIYCKSLLASDKGKSLSQFEQKLAQIVDERGFQIAFFIHGHLRQTSKFKDVRVF